MFVYMGRVHGPCTRTFTEPCTGRVHGPCIRLCTGRVQGRVRAVSYRVDGRVRAIYTARVDEHIHGCVWDVYMTVYMARYGRLHGPRPQRAVSARVHGRVHGACTAF